MASLAVQYYINQAPDSNDFEARQVTPSIGKICKFIKEANLAKEKNSQSQTAR